MDLYLRKVVHAQAHDNYRVLLKHDDLEVEVGPRSAFHLEKESGAGKREAPGAVALQGLSDRRRRVHPPAPNNPE